MFVKIASKMLYKTKLTNKHSQKKTKEKTILLIHHIVFLLLILINTWKQQREVNNLATAITHVNCYFKPHHTDTRIVSNPHCGFPQLYENKVKHFHVIWKSWRQRHFVVQLCSYPFVETHNRPHGHAKSTATADATTE